MVSISEAAARLDEVNANWLKGFCDGVGVPLTKVAQSWQMTEAGFRELRARYVKLGRRQHAAA